MDKNATNKFKDNLQKMADLAMSIASSYSAFIFLPKEQDCSQKNDEKLLELQAFASQEKNFNTKITVGINSGIIGYVARHRKAIHISPFDKDSKHIGIYYTDEKLKSILALPIVLDNFSDQTGVLLCDSKKAFAFSKLQCSILNKLTGQISTLYNLSSLVTPTAKKQDWASFIKKSEKIIDTLTPNCVDILRMKLTNLEDAEAKIGSGKIIAVTEAIERLMIQCIPPQSTTFKLPLGDIVIILDNMMTGHIEKKILSIVKRVSLSQKVELKIEFTKRSCRALKHPVYKLEDLISRCRKDENLELTKVAV